MLSRLARLATVHETYPVDAFLLTHPPTIRHLSGYFFNFETGPSPFHLLPAALIALPGSDACLIAADTETGQIATLPPPLEIKLYESYVYERPLDFARQFQIRLHEMITQFGLSKACLGVELKALPVLVQQELSNAFPDIRLVDVSKEVEQLRLSKDPDELEMIQKAVHLCDVGQETLLKEARPGISELELFSCVRTAMEAEAGRRFPLMADFVSGPRTGEAGGGPTNRIIETGELILSDLTPCLDGYWGDTCQTMVVGKPSSIQQTMFQRVKEALHLGIQAIRPGVKASAIDQLMRDHLAGLGTYSHHSGHGVGVVYHEEPRIVPYNDLELSPYMVVALEPGIYRDNQGVRLEHVAVVTENGCELLSRFQHRLTAD
jgi:Xaa-Pro dipeptidase